MKKEIKIWLNSGIWIYLWLILQGEISYNEELELWIIYIILFVLISESSREMIRKLIIKENTKIMWNYEQIIYLKKKTILKGVEYLKKIIKIDNIKSIINIQIGEIKKKEINYENKKKKIQNIIEIYNISFLLSNKIIENKE